MEIRLCNICKKEKPVSDFYETRKGSGKFKSECKRCDCARKIKPPKVIPDLEGEVWSDIVGYEGVYLVSNKCRFRRIMHRANPTNKLISCRLYEGNEYIQVTLCLNGKATAHLAHRLVALAFIPNPEDKPEVNHKNGIKTDNWVENLEWSTKSENQLHALELGLSKSKRGEAHYACKLTEKNVLEIRAIGKTMLQREIASIYNTTSNTVGKILRRERWTHI